MAQTELRPGQSVELLKELHILTRDGKMNQDSRRKLKQVNHLCQFIEPLLAQLREGERALSLVDHGAGKSYLGFILYDLFLKSINDDSHVYSIETRAELVERSRELANRLAALGVAFVRDGARVDDTDLGRFIVERIAIPGGDKTLAHVFGFVLIDFATKGDSAQSRRRSIIQQR